MTHQVHSVRADVAPFVVGVDGKVEPHEVVEVRVFESQLAGEVGAVVQAGVGGDELSAFERAA
jgi:hypothetical protein